MNKIKLFIASMLGAIALVFACVLGTRVNAGTSNTTYSLDAKVSSISNISQSTSGYFTVAKGSSAASVGGGNCTATFTSIIDGNNYTANNSSIKGIKMESSTTIKFTTTVNSTSTVTVLWSNNSTGKNGTTIKFDGTASTNSVDGVTNYATQTWSGVSSGEHTISAGTDQAAVFEVVVVESITTAEGTYNVTYNKNGHGSQPDPEQSVTALPASLPQLSETGYSFGGWFYDDKTFENEAKANDSINTDTVLYAKWTVNTSEWCTITFNSNGGSEVASTSQIYGSSYTLPNCTLDGYYLKGWFDGSKLNTGKYTVPSKSAQTLTAQWAETISFDESCSFSKADSNNTAAASNDMFTVSGKVNTNSDAAVTYNGITYSTPLKMESSTTLTFTLTKDATIYIAFTSATGNCNIQEANDAKATKYAASNGVVIKRLSAGSYTILKADTNNIGFIGLIYDINKTASLSFDKQFDKDGSEATKLRFIGTIEGLAYADYNKIESITFTFTFNGSNRECGVGTLYKSITGLSGYGENAYKMYFVYQLDHVNRSAYVDLSLTNCKLTVVFTDGTSKDVDHADIDLPSFFDVYYVDAE